MARRGTSEDHPALASLDVIRVKADGGFATALRDGEGVGETVLVRPPLDGVLHLFDGAHDLDQIAAAARVRRDAVERLVRDLSRSFLLDGPTRDARRAALVEAFARLDVRPASHAGGAYHDDPRQLARFIEVECLGTADPPNPRGRATRGLVAPHMDLWRASRGYGSAYRALELEEEADTFVLLGTCHAGMASPFSICRKAFATPLGTLACATDLADGLARAASFDVYADEYQHKAEHSIEFQAVFLRHALGAERAARSRILPILCGLGRAIGRRRSPTEDRHAEGFLSALADRVAALGRRVVVIAGADLAHVGPRFGDPAPLDGHGRAKLEALDRASIAHALRVDHGGFFDDTASDVDVRRVCGIGPIYTALRLAEALGAKRSKLHHYTQHVAPDEGSIVSHASVTFEPTPA